MQQTRVLIRNILSHYGREILLVLLVLVLNPFLFRRLGEAAYGVYSLSLTATTALYLLDAGFAHALARYVSKFHTMNDQASLRRFVSTGFVLYAAIGLFAFVILSAVGRWTLPSLGVPAEWVQVGADLFVITGLTVAIRFAGYTAEGILRGVQKLHIIHGAVLINRLLFALGAVVTLLNGGGLREVAYCLLAAMTIAQGIRIVYARKSLPGVRVSLGDISGGTVKEMFSFGSMAFLTQISSTVEKSGTRVTLSSFLGSTWLGGYNLIVTCSTLLTRLAAGVTQAILPAASRLETIQDQAALRKLVSLGSRVVVGLTAPAAIALAIWSKPFLLLWIGPELEPFGWLLAALVILQALDLATGTAPHVLIGMGHPRPIGIGYAVGSCLQVLTLLLLLALRPQWGALALVIAVGLGVFVRRFAALRAIQRELGFGIWTFAKEVWLPAAPALAVGAAASWVLERTWSANSWIVLLTSFAISAVTFWIPFAMLALSRDERAWATERVRRRLRPTG